MTKTTWDGSNMTQDDMMLKDTVLVLDYQDNIIGSESKKQSHVFNTQQPRGVLHRAFSVFLFDLSTNELLLQQRASTKITFPNVCAVYNIYHFVCCFLFCKNVKNPLYTTTVLLENYHYYSE